MQTKKTERKDRILKAAKEEFIKNGFNKTSLRSVASKTGMTVSNLYVYFKSKNELFKAIVSPLLNEIDEIMINMDDLSVYEDDRVWEYEYYLKYLPEMIDFIERNRNELNLLIFKSSGSDLQGYKDDFIDRYTLIYKKHLAYLADVRPDINSNISDFFIHNMISLHVNLVSEIIMHKIGKDKMGEFFEEFSLFYYYGQKALFGF